MLRTWRFISIVVAGIAIASPLYATPGARWLLELSVIATLAVFAVVAHQHGRALPLVYVATFLYACGLLVDLSGSDPLGGGRFLDQALGFAALVGDALFDTPSEWSRPLPRWRPRVHTSPGPWRLATPATSTSSRSPAG